MPDFFDRVQERVQQDTDDAIARALQTRRPGLAECEECGEPITPLRQGLGARRCMPHQAALEKRGHR